MPAFDSAEAISIVEKNLGAPVGQMYESFDAEPIAAASLGQVGLGAAVPDRHVALPVFPESRLQVLNSVPLRHACIALTRDGQDSGSQMVACFGQPDPACMRPHLAGGLRITKHQNGVFGSWLLSAFYRFNRHATSTEHTDKLSQA